MVHVLLHNCLFLVVLFCTQLSSETLVLSTIQRAPISTEHHDGFADSVAMVAFHRLGISLIIQHIPAKRALVNANKGRTDGDLARIKGVEKTYPNLIRVPEVIWVAEINAFSKDPTIILNNWKDLKSYSVAYVRGWVVFDRHVPKEAMVNRVLFPEALFKMLDRRRVELALYEKKMGLSVINNFAFEEIEPVNNSLLTTPIYIYLHKKHSAIVPKLAQVIKDMKQDGTYDKIMQSTLGKVLSTSDLEIYRRVYEKFENLENQ